jgi:hypothetical protein
MSTVVEQAQPQMDQMIGGYLPRPAFCRGRYCGCTYRTTRPFTSMVADVQPLGALDRDWNWPIHEYPIPSDWESGPSRGLFLSSKRTFVIPPISMIRRLRRRSSDPGPVAMTSGTAPKSAAMVATGGRQRGDDGQGVRQALVQNAEYDIDSYEGGQDQ